MKSRTLDCSVQWLWTLCALVLRQKHIKLLQVGAEVLSSTQPVRACFLHEYVTKWSAYTRLSHEVDVYPAGERRCVCLHGGESSVMVSESEGCEDALLTESCLTLSFTHTVQCWSLHRNGRALAWSAELSTAENTGIVYPLYPALYKMKTSQVTWISSERCSLVE